MAMLDMIITHWREPAEEGMWMFDMLKLQLGVNRDETNVIIVQDGKQGKPDATLIQEKYPFVREVIEQPEKGVSAARNLGMDRTASPWIMFCDFDDCLYNVESLNMIIESIRESGERADLFWSDIWVETRTKDMKYAHKLKEWNSVFIHGKVYRREFLEKHGIRFDEELSYSEDAMFNSLVAMHIDYKRIGKINMPTYMWRFREESLSNYTGGEGKRNVSLYKKRVKVIEEYLKLGREYEANASAARALLDYYWEAAGDNVPEGWSKEEWDEKIREIVRLCPEAFRVIAKEDRWKLYRISREEAIHKRFNIHGLPPAEEWLRGIGAIEK